MSTEWNVEEVFKRFLDRALVSRQDPKIDKNLLVNLDPNKPVPLEILELALERLAQLHILYGDALLPLFERIEKEIDIAQTREQTKARIDKINARLNQVEG